MSESMSSPWIRDYLIDVAETYGVQLYNTPLPKGKKRVQLTNVSFLLVRTTTNPESPLVSHLSCRQLCLGMDIRQGLSSVRPLLKRCRRCVQEVGQSPNTPAFTFSILVTVNMVATSLTLAIPSFSSPAIAQYFLHALLVQSHPDIHPYPTYLLKSTVSL